MKYFDIQICFVLSPRGVDGCGILGSYRKNSTTFEPSYIVRLITGLNQACENNNQFCNDFPGLFERKCGRRVDYDLSGLNTRNPVDGWHDLFEVGGKA